MYLADFLVIDSSSQIPASELLAPSLASPYKSLSLSFPSLFQEDELEEG